MEANKVQQFFAMQLMSNVIKESVGDSNMFQLIMESMIKAMDNGELLTGIDLGSGENLSGEAAGSSIEAGKDNPAIDAAVDKAADKYGVDEELIDAVIQAESSYNPMAKSSAGAMGLMQLMPGTADAMGVSNAYDIEENVDGGTKYLSGLLEMYGNSKELALAAYNAGPGTVSTRGVKDKGDIGKMPSETRDYVKKVMKYYGK